MKKLSKNLEMSRSDVEDELVVAFRESEDLHNIARKGLKHPGYENISNDELKVAYYEHFDKNITIVD